MKKRVLSIVLTLALVMTCFAGMTVPVYAAGTAADVVDFPDTQGCHKGDACLMYDFTDVNMGAWYHHGVHFCLTNGLMNGKADYQFDPDGMATRASWPR